MQRSCVVLSQNCLPGQWISFFYSISVSVKMAILSKGTASVIRIMKWFFSASLLIALCGPTAHAQSTVAAASCNLSDVNAVINGPSHTAVNGDTINIPAGSCQWTGTLTISGKGIALVGAGAGSTIIVDNGGSSNPIINVSGVPRGQLMRISSMTLQPQSSSTSLMSPIWVAGTCTASGCPNLRIDHIDFTAMSTSNTAWLVRTTDVFGVLDHNLVSNTLLAQPMNASYLGVGLYGDNSWAQPDTLGTSSALYFEDNTFSNNGGPQDCDEGIQYQTSGGCRIVVRHNTYKGLASSASYFHGTDTTGRPRGGRQLEFYNNTIGCTGNCFGVLSTMRSGVGYIYNNNVTTTGSGAVNYYIAALVLRSYRGPSPGFGSCDGTGIADDNNGVVYASGTITSVGSSASITDGSKSWTANQWVGPNGNPYSIHDVTQKFGVEIASSTSNTITTTTGPLNNTNSPFTWNVGDSYQILRASACVDQPGRGQGTYISGSTPTPAGWVSERLDPVYEWGNTVTGSHYNLGITANGTNRLIANRDFYSAATSFDGTSGTGTGLYSAIPATCTPAVAYWATDQNTLYKCTATNTWTASYTPYTYPHPLTTGSVTSSAPAPPGGLTATVQ